MLTETAFEIPLPALGFPEKTLIMCLGRSHDRAYSARMILSEGSLIHEEFDFSPEEVRFQYSDREGMNFSQRNRGGPGTLPGKEEHNKEHYLSVFGNILYEKLRQWFQQGKFAHLVVFVPDEMTPIIQKLPPEIIKKADVRAGNFMKIPLTALMRRIFA